jgi:ribosomal protein S18 acetylase RimI-like enzyme
MVSLRQAVRADAAAISAVHDRARTAYYQAAGYRPVSSGRASSDRDEMWVHLIGATATRVTLAEHAGRVAGFMCSREEKAPPGALELVALYVLPESWGLGIGSTLYASFLAELQVSGLDRAVLEVWDRNDRAKAFYLRRGWIPTGSVRSGPLNAPFIELRAELENATTVGSEP